MKKGKHKHWQQVSKLIRAIKIPAKDLCTVYIAIIEEQ